MIAPFVPDESIISYPAYPVQIRRKPRSVIFVRLRAKISRFLLFALLPVPGQKTQKNAQIMSKSTYLRGILFVPLPDASTSFRALFFDVEHDAEYARKQPRAAQDNDLHAASLLSALLYAHSGGGVKRSGTPCVRLCAFPLLCMKNFP